MLPDENPKRLAQITLVALLLLGCVAVLLPFIGAVLFAFVLWICTWPSYARYLLPRVRGRKSLGAALMTCFFVLILLVPTIFLTIGIVGSIELVIETARPILERGLPAHAPEFLRQIPVFGPEIEQTWHKLASNRNELNAAARQLIDPARNFLIGVGKVAGNGLLQLALVLFVLFFLYRDGAALSRTLRTGSARLGGELGEEMLEMTRNTVIGVMLGIVGTAAAQAAIAALGFVIAGVPAALLLGFATFLLSMVPVGPPLVWGGAAAWLYSQGETGWAIFMVAYGLLVISSIDNFLKPVLMARGAGVSILLIALGVLGGLMVFGFIGIFLGPVLLALAHMLIERWTGEQVHHD